MARRSTRALPQLCFAAVVVILSSLPALAQTNLRNTWPGRRVGGGTRGECTARAIVHLVPPNSVFASGTSRLLGILEGPTANPVPVQVNFRPEADRNGRVTRLELPATPAGILLLRQPAGLQPSLWESNYQCESTTAPSDDPLSFVSAGSPPPQTLLVADTTAADQSVQKALAGLLKACGSSVSRDSVAKDFGLTDVLLPEAWPERLPVRCPN